MDTTLYNKDGEAIAYIADDYNSTIFMWDGHPVAYQYEEQYIFGMNGRHLGWFINDIFYNNSGERIGFTSNSCPVSVAKESVKDKQYPMDTIRPRWAVSPFPNLSFKLADQELSALLLHGQIPVFSGKSSEEETTTEDTDI